MEISSHEESMIKLQKQMVHNQHDVQDYLSDLANWENEMKSKEESKKTKVEVPQISNLPPVRNSLDKKKLKKKRKTVDGISKPKKISGCDFNAWDKYDVDQALDEVDEARKSSSEYETDEDWEDNRRKHLANEEKNKGNTHLSAGAYEAAVEAYSRGIGLDPTSYTLYANRALAHLKLERFAAAEVDCSTSIALQPIYVKAYLRRAAARLPLGRLSEACEDYSRVLKLEPNNKHAQLELAKIHKEMERMKHTQTNHCSHGDDDDANIVPIYKPPDQRSRKALRRVDIEEIGKDTDTERDTAAVAKVIAQQGDAKKVLEARDSAMFEHYMGKVSHPASGSPEAGTCDRSTDGGFLVQRNEESDTCLSTSGGRPLKQSAEKCVSTRNSHYSDPVSSFTSALTGSVDDRHRREILTQNKISSSLACKRSSSSVVDAVSHGVTVVDNGAVKSSYQFLVDFKVLKDDLTALYAYVKNMKPSSYPQVFGHSLEATFLLTIVEAFLRHGIPAGEDCFWHMKGLADVKRFSMVMMFLSAKEKEGIREVFTHLRSQGKHPEKVITDLMKKYEL